MREILFRGKTTKDKEWVYGDLLHDGYDYDVAIWEQKYKLVTEISPETVGQYTGLTANGKKIFEGDIVKFTDSPFGYSYTGVVCFSDGSFCIKYEYWKKEKFHRIGQTDKWQDMGASGIITYQYEILGNIHDNPELLENP